MSTSQTVSTIIYTIINDRNYISPDVHLPSSPESHLAMSPDGINQSLTTVFADSQNDSDADMSTLERINDQYKMVHGYMAVGVCLFGIVSNLLNIIVLTRKHMYSPTNVILTALATSDMLTMTPYVVFAIYLYIITVPECMESMKIYHTKSWMTFVIINNLFMITCHMISMWLTVSLAVFRYIFVCKHQLVATWCSMRRAKITILVVYVGSLTCCIPLYLLNKTVDVGMKNFNKSCYMVYDSDLVGGHPAIRPIIYWLYGVVIKIAPCVLLIILSTFLIHAMQKAKQRRARLLNSISRVTNQDSEGEHNRTTMMLVAVVLCFVITELPQGILALVGGVSKKFMGDVYIHLGDMMDILVLINSAFNFILYCIMSQQFRDTFKSLFLIKPLSPLFNRSAHHHHPVETDYSLVKTGTNGTEHTAMETTHV